jgi:hypothetical protein
MREITKYMVTGIGIDLANNSIIAGYAEVTDCEQPICMWSDVEPIIQRNAELEAELARLREQEPIGVLTDRGIDWEDSFFTDVVIGGDGDCNLYTEPKPAQEILSELVKWANNNEPNLEMDDSADVALEKTVRNECRAFVKSQLEKMKGGE